MPNIVQEISWESYAWLSSNFINLVKYKLIGSPTNPVNLELRSNLKKVGIITQAVNMMTAKRKSIWITRQSELTNIDIWRWQKFLIFWLCFLFIRIIQISNLLVTSSWSEYFWVLFFLHTRILMIHVNKTIKSVTVSKIDKLTIVYAFVIVTDAKLRCTFEKK